MQCPICNKPLSGIDYEGVHIDTCPMCGGDWLDSGELNNILHARQTRFSEKECLAVAQAAKITGVKLPKLDRHLTCPKCGGATDPINYGDDSGIIIDKCTSCNGLWLNRGELDKIDELVHGWNDELPEDLKQYGPKLRQVAMQINQDLQVNISHSRLVNSAINGVFDFFGE